MSKLISILLIVIPLVLFPPAVLALISNNAVPGDVSYPIKRGLEDIIYAVSSVNPVTRAWFAAARSERRFQEIKVLVTQGKETEATLNELVGQVEIAVGQIESIDSQVKKEQLAQEFLQSIQKMDLGLKEVQQTVEQSSPPTLTTTMSPAAIPTPTSITRPSPTPVAVAFSEPTPTVEPAPKPAEQASPTLPTKIAVEETSHKLQETRKRLEKLRERLEEVESSEKDQDHKSKSKEKKKDREDD